MARQRQGMIKGSHTKRSNFIWQVRSLYYVTDPVSAVIKLRSNLINACLLLPLLLSAQHCSCRFNA